MMALQHGVRRLRSCELLGLFVRIPPDGGGEICGIGLDRRRRDAGGLFLACCGAANHGLDFAACTRDLAFLAGKGRESDRGDKDLNICCSGVAGLRQGRGGSAA